MFQGRSTGSRIKGIFNQNQTPDISMHPDQIPFIRVDEGRCVSCSACEPHCPVRRSVPEKDYDSDRTRPDECINCGQCLIHCPSGAVYEDVSWLADVEAAIHDADTITVAIISPSIRGDMGTSNEKIAGALSAVGFDIIWENECGADITIHRELAEFKNRLTGESDRPLPQFTSCCPGFVKYIETSHPDLHDHLSLVKSPVASLGALAKSSIAAKKVFTASIMPCVAKKYEQLRPEQHSNRIPDIDATLTTREFVHLLDKHQIDISKIHSLSPDVPGEKSPSSETVFVHSGGVMKAIAHLLQKEAGQPASFRRSEIVPGMTECSFMSGDKIIRAAIITGITGAARICDEIRLGKSPYHFVEVLACPGGCSQGGGRLIRYGFFSYAQRALRRLSATGRSSATHLFLFIRALSERLSMTTGKSASDRSRSCTDKIDANCSAGNSCEKMNGGKLPQSTSPIPLRSPSQ
jgi:ferredoxin hydrogenase large subunit